MPAPIAVSLALLLGLAADEGTGLRTLAAASNRPPECAALARGSARPSIWQLARAPRLAGYCDRVARAHAALANSADVARKHAEAALELLPGGAAPWVVIGRVLHQKGDDKGALEAFEKAIAIDPAAVDEPRAMADHARALTRTGRFADAASLYRILVSRAALLPEPARSRVRLQAAFATMNAVTKPEERGSALEAAASLLSEARDQSGDLAPDVVLVSVLVHDRKGNAERTAALVAEARRLGAHVDEQAPEYVASDADLAALRAVDAEINDPAKAREAWKAYETVAGPSSPWASGSRKGSAVPTKPPSKPPTKQSPRKKPK